MPNRRAATTVAAAVLAAATSLALGAPALAAEQAPTPGAAGSGDPYFPRQGNGGYDVSHYDLDLAWKTTNMLTGTAVITARATQDLSRFDLDLRTTMQASSVEVDGQPATAVQPVDQQQELVVTPAHPLPAGSTFTVRVRYGGVAQPVTDPDGSLDGFIPTDDGAFVASEPQGAPSWYPVDDAPSDKATYAISMTVPKGLVAVSNGRLVRQRDAARTTTWSWRMDRPISSYLVTATIGKFDVHTGTTGNGVPYFVAVDPRESAKADPVLAKLPDIVDYFSSVYGAYPFGETGAIVDRAPQVGYALETATRPIFDRAPSESTLAHELAHQWYGDSVTVQHWRDIWLNEGFAEFSTWLWEEHTGGRTTAEHLRDLLALPASRDDEWLPPPGNPGDGEGIFSGSVYDRGAATLAALRDKLGDATFFRIMRGWFAATMYGNAHVGQFTDYAASLAHQDLHAFFHNWLYAPRKPHL